MTVGAISRRAGPTPGNSAATNFPFAFKTFLATDLLVQMTVLATGVITTLVLNDLAAGYTVTLNPDQNANPGGVVTYNPSTGAMPATQTLTITSQMPEAQGTHLVNGGNFNAANVEDMADKDMMATQDLAVKVAASIQFPAVDGALSGTLPAKAQRANLVLGFDALGNILMTAGGTNVPISVAMTPVVQAATLALGRTALGFSGAGGTVAYTNLAPDVQAAQNSLVNLLHIDTDTGHRDMIASGWMPAFFNQQWGGAPHYFELADGATGATYKFEAATGFVEQTTGTSGGFSIADAAARTGVAEGFKVSKSDNYSAIWVKIGKVGNPTNNLEMRIQADDGSGVKPTANFTAITNGTATSQSGKLHSSDQLTQWVRFVFPAPCALVAGTQYHLVLKSSGAVDAANYWVWGANLTLSKYPFGCYNAGNAVPAWATTPGSAQMFLVEAPTTTASLQSGGMFNDGKLVFFEGSPLSQSNARVKDLRDFRGLDLTDFTLLVRGTAWTKDKTILDITYGLDHDRIVLRSNTATGFAQVDLYDSTGTKKTVTATTVDLSAGDHDVAIRIRAKGDGADVVGLYVDGAANGAQLTAQTIVFDKLFGLAQIGTFWLGGGFQVTPVWTKDTTMATLPSADGWTWTTSTATVEASAMSVSGGKLYQNKNGYAAGGDGYYEKAALGLSNANGWAVATKTRSASNPNTKATAPHYIQVFDGAKSSDIGFKEYFIESYSFASNPVTQVDFKSQESVLFLVGKGSDSFTIINGRVVVDGTGLMTAASALNRIDFGDGSAVANENADAVWDYVKYYNTAWLPPQITSGSLSELAIWNGDKTSMLDDLYNAAAPFSVKQFCGMPKNYVGDEVVQRYQRQGITASPSTSAVYPATAILPEMEAFFIGSSVDQDGRTSISNNTGVTDVNLLAVIDGNTITPTIQSTRIPTLNYEASMTAQNSARVPFGLHKSELRFAVSGGTATRYGVPGTFKTEAKA